MSSHSHPIINWFLFSRELIVFTADKSAPAWKGFTYSFLLFAVALVQSMILHQYFHRCFLTGMRLRTSLIAAVYRKVIFLYILWCILLYFVKLARSVVKGIAFMFSLYYFCMLDRWWLGIKKWEPGKIFFICEILNECKLKERR